MSTNNKYDKNYIGGAGMETYTEYYYAWKIYDQYTNPRSDNIFFKSEDDERATELKVRVNKLAEIARKDGWGALDV